MLCIELICYVITCAVLYCFGLLCFGVLWYELYWIVLHCVVLCWFVIFEYCKVGVVYIYCYKLATALASALMLEATTFSWLRV